ncbi:sodium:proton exchanger [Sulfurimonas sp. HSL3-7]|uniref:calcium:proton antiporter n=1 Tax=Sulfonitrofixus jiaomeiensis TaxID=3131938 RepID=UPI0031F7F1A6
MPSRRSILSTIYDHHATAIIGLFFALLTFVFHYLGNPYMATLFAAVSIALLSLTVAEAAEVLAERLDEPYGSFVLTFSAVIVEIILLFLILLEAGHNPDAMETVKGGIISAVIVDMNVLLGLAVFIGGLAFKAQEHNEDTSSTYTTILLVASSALLVPSILHYTTGNSDDLANASLLIAAVLFIFYIVIFIFQTKTHSHFFKATARSRIFRFKNRLNENEEDEEADEDLFEKMNTPFNFVAIFMLIAMIGYIAEIFANEGMQLVSAYNFPVGLAGLVIAIISVSPEIITAIKAAKNDQIQRVVNIAMGASTVSIMLTVPILLAMSYATEHPLTLDFNTLQIGALILTIILAWKTTDDGETNYFEGTSHLIFFTCYAIVLAFM